MTTQPTTTGTQNRSAKTWYIYFVAYQCMGNGGLGFGNMELPFAREITELADVQVIERHLRANGYPSALVMGYTLLRIEAGQAGGAR